MKLNIQCSGSREELLSTLARLDISVPSRIGGRTTEHTECWIMARLLATLAQEDYLAFPLSLAHRDRPDFLLQSADTQIGVEATEAISTQFAAYCALAEREFPDALIEPARFRWGQAEMSASEMRHLLKENKLQTDGWCGGSPEQEWALYLQRVIDTKLDKITQPSFSKFSNNWLAIYDNLPFGNIHLEKAISLLKPLIKSTWRKNPSFDIVFIERGPMLAKLEMESSKHILLKNLWP